MLSAAGALIAGQADAEQAAAPARAASAAPAPTAKAPAAPVSATPAPARDAASPRQVRLVTTEQYLNTISNVFGVDAQPSTRFSPVQRVDGLLQLGTLKAGVSETDIELYQSAAQSVVTNALSEDRRTFLMPCRPARPDRADAACAARTLQRFGTLLLRRDMTPAELAQYAKIAGASADRLHDFHRGLGVALESLLISPEALIVVEETEPDPAAPGQLRLTAFSLASRLSYFLWNAAPDRALLDAARTGELQTEAGRARAVDRMIASPRFQVGMRAFFSDVFALDEMDVLAKDSVIYPDFTLATAADAREQLLRTVIDQTVVRKRDYRDLFITRETFMSPALAAIYEVPATSGWSRHTFAPQSSRAGIQSLVGFLAGHAHPGRSSPTLRGKALRELALCQRIPPPPPDVDFSKLANPSPMRAPSATGWVSTCRTPRAQAATGRWTRRDWRSKTSTVRAGFARRTMAR